MLKVSTFAAENELGYTAVPLFGPSDSEFEKRASATLLPSISTYINGLRPRQGSQYVLVNALAAGEYFGCFPAGTLVETNLGERNIEEVEPGTLVRTHENRLRPVLARTPKRTGELCDLYAQGLPSNLPSLTATPNHELWVVTRQDFVQAKRRIAWKGDTSIPVEKRREQALREMEFSWVPVSHLQPGDYIAEPFPLEEDPAALGDERWNCPEVAFLMGLYAAEGCIAYRYDREDDRPASVIYVVSGAETDVIEEARKHAETLGHGLQDYESASGTSYRLQLCFAEFARLCMEHIGTPATDKKLSLAILRMPRVWQKTFFAAYAAGDGCVRTSVKEEAAIRCVSASAALLRGMRLLVARDGLVGSISGRHNRKSTWYNGNPIYELSISGGQFKGRGTPKSYLHPDGFILSAVKRVEQYSWEGEVYDLTVEEDSSFVASGICVHNSNINGDYFPEAALIHAPYNWQGNPVFDRALGADWAYGFPTFYGAKPYAHHRNKDPSRAYGEVELTEWNDAMKRVELVVRVDYDKCVEFGGIQVWDKLKNGQFPDVSMGCFTAGTLVTMSDGTRKPIELVERGDRVLTHLGRPRRVLATQRKQYSGKLYTIRPEAHAAFTCTEEHPFYCAPSKQVRHKDQSQRRWTDPAKVLLVPEWLSARNLGNNDLVEPVLQGVLTPEYATREFCRLFGYYLAEGHIVRDEHGKIAGIVLSTHVDDAVHGEIADLCLRVGTRNPPSWFDSSTSILGKGIYVFDHQLAERFLELGGCGAKTKRLAEEVLHWHPDLQAEIIGAYANGDGCYVGGGALSLSSANRDLMFQWLTILPRLGIAASMQGLAHKAGSGFSNAATFEWVVHIGKQFVGPLAVKCAKVRNEAVLRTKNSRMFFGEYLVTPVREVHESTGNVEVFNLEVEEDNSYLVGNLAAHNSKVPYDTSSITLDWELYREAQATFDPKKHKHPGLAVLEFHKKLKAKTGKGIPGLSITRGDYDEYCTKRMNFILPDGRKVFVYNDYPRFFDISFVFIGADRTAKTMVYIYRDLNIPSVKIAEALGYEDMEDRVSRFMEKAASVPEQNFVDALVKGAEQKRAEIEKQVIPSQMAGKAIPLMTAREPDLPTEVLNAMAAKPLDASLSTASGLCMVLKPREFQRVVLVGMGKPDLADAYDSQGVTFSGTEDKDESLHLSPEKFLPALARMLLPLFDMRTAMAPAVEQRVVSSAAPVTVGEAPSSHSSELLRKIGSAYNSYRDQLLAMAPHSQVLLQKVASSNDADLMKVASADAADTFTPLSFLYLRDAYKDRLPAGV